MDWAALIKEVRIDTAYGPPIVLDHPFDSSANQKPSKLLSALKPQITIVPGDALASLVSHPVMIAPYGRPGQTKWPQVEATAVIAGAVVLGLLGVGAISLWRSLR